MTTIERMAAWAASLSFDEIPARVVEKARWQQASVLAASFAGLNDAGAEKVVAWARAQAGDGAAGTRVLAGGFRAPRAVAAIANAAVSCTFDFDEVLLVGHPGHSTVTLPLSLGEELGASWGEAIAAQVAGNEIAARLGLSTFVGPQNGQMLPFLHCAGATVAAGRLLRLDGTKLAHALAVALAQPPAALWPGFLGPIESKLLVAAHATAMGLHAAELAAQGFTGALDLLDHPRGFFHRFSFAPVRRALGGLGRAWLSDTLQVKLHAACWYYQALVDGLVEALRPLGPLQPRDVRRVRCRVSFLAEAVDASERVRPRGPLVPNEINFAIPAAVACTLLHGRLHPDDLTPAVLAAREPEVRELAARVTVEHDAVLSRRLLGVVDRALDLPGLVGDVGVRRLARAAARLRHEFPHAGALRPSEALGAVVRAPSAVAQLLAARRRSYDLGERDVAGLVMAIPAGFELELDGGRRLADERDVPAGALSLPDAPARAAAKLRESARRPLADAADALVRGLAEARPTTPIARVLAPLPT